jgi:hypothetical protein
MSDGRVMRSRDAGESWDAGVRIGPVVALATA